MATSLSNPTVRRRELARRLRELRLATGHSVDEVAKELMCSAAKVSRMETGERGVQQRDVRDLCRFYGVESGERDRLMKLAQEAARRGWWQDFRSLDQQVANYVALESAAERIRSLQLLLLPGLLQTPEYTRALLRHLRVPAEMTPAQVEEAIELRTRRQERLVSGDVSLTALIDEAAFRRMVGSRKIMLDQLSRLIESTDLKRATVQIIPFSAGPHAALEGPFQHLHLDASVEDIVFVEGSNGYFLLEDAEQVQGYLSVHSRLCAEVALDPDDSLAWLKQERDRWAG